MVACTFLSAPLMFISAKMLTLTNLTPSNYIKELDTFLFDISIVSIIATVLNVPSYMQFVLINIYFMPSHSRGSSEFS